MDVSVKAENVSDELPEEHRTCVYRVVQEALHNCAQHAGARKVRIVVRQDSGRLLLTVEDDGRGFDAANTRGLGLLGMEERVQHLGGAFQVHSTPGRGTSLRVELPLTQTTTGAEVAYG
jgi:signal transduction histidine kinase